MVSLSELLPTEAIRLDVPAADWRAALRTAGDLLVATGSGTDAYTDEMISNVEEHGPYIVLAPGFAFAHARPSPAVRRTGMAWVRPAEPVRFGHEANDPVTLVVALAAEDSGAHTAAMAALARLLGNPATEAALRAAPGLEALRRVLEGEEPEAASGPRPATASARRADQASGAPSAGPNAQSVHKILTVCGNGLGTSLFLKNTLERVVERWGWTRHLTVEATDTISAKGKASEAVAVLTSREIAEALGDIGVPVRVVADFTSGKQVDAALRDIYDV
ncbi:PTS sugar transporter subunit IIA [Streptomyces reniochalinae]|uniref:Ascorbate-specific PTS system EIIA component n=1 Tax=Streptomyces reniochalinae TaxID=2250578 RepID=A0A367EY18_9ACTN|nr:PTS sugar transporter subunit IIA [Streptomyces reniochalinae]RCG22287.1 PTS sugar transporter [Streptomyces reniochalinae]